MSAITTHILDTALGRPADGVRVTLAQWVDDQWQTLGSGITDNDGRIGDLLSGTHLLQPGLYRLLFQTGDYFAAQSCRTFYPQVTIDFSIDDPTVHYHVPLLLSPFGYSTYRGS